MCATSLKIQSMINVAIFASGSGSNAENIINYFRNSDKINIKTIVSNKADAFVHQRAQKNGIPSKTFAKVDFFESDKILDYLKSESIDFIVLAGFLLKVPQNIIEAYPRRIVNIHPALLPKYGGKGMYGDHVHKAVVEGKESQSGITVHYVNENYDEGDIIFQATCNVDTDDTFLEVAEKVHKLEYEYFPSVIEEVTLRLM